MKTTLLRLLVRFLSLLPLPLLRGLGGVAGRLLWRIPNRERETARVNLRLCFPQMEPEARERLLRACLRETATTLLEMPAVWYGDTGKWLARMEADEVRGEIRRLLEQGRGLVVAMPHLGNFELGAHFFGDLAPATGLYRPPRKAGLEPVMLEGRSRPGRNRMVATDRSGIRALHQALGRGEIVVILPDQQPKAQRGGAGVFAPFFGVPALTMTLVHRLARRHGSPVYFIGFLRQRRTARYRVVGLEGDPAIGGSDPVAAAAALNAGVEALVRQAPEQYQWTYRRFERQPDGTNPYRRPEG